MEFLYQKQGLHSYHFLNIQELFPLHYLHYDHEEELISFFERKILLRLLNYYSDYFSNAEIKRIKNISFAILDPNFPSNNSKRLYLYKKDLILNRLLLNFRHRNYLTIEAFANFSLENYSNFLDNVLEKAAHIYFSNASHADLINFILNNLLK